MKQKILVGVITVVISSSTFADEFTEIFQSSDADNSDITIIQTGGDNRLFARQGGTLQDSRITATISGANNTDRHDFGNTITQTNTDGSTLNADVSGDSNIFRLYQGASHVGLSDDNQQNIDISGDNNHLNTNQLNTSYSQLDATITGNNNQIVAAQTGNYSGYGSNVRNLSAVVEAHGDNGVINLCQGDSSGCSFQQEHRFNTRAGAAETLSLNLGFGLSPTDFEL